MLLTPDIPQVRQNETLEEYVMKHAVSFLGIGTLFSSNSAAKQRQSLFVSSANRQD